MGGLRGRTRSSSSRRRSPQCACASTYTYISCSIVIFFFYFFLFLPNAPRYIVVYSSLWVLLVVACGTLPQRGLMSSAMSAPRIRTNETLGQIGRAHV